MAGEGDEARHWSMAWCEAQLLEIRDMIDGFKADIRAADVAPGDLIGLGRKMRAAALLLRFVIQVQRLGALLAKAAVKPIQKAGDGMETKRGDRWDDASDDDIEAELGRRLARFHDIVEEKGRAWRQSAGGDAGRDGPAAGAFARPPGAVS